MLTEARKIKLGSHRPSVRKSIAANRKSSAEVLSLYASDPIPAFANGWQITETLHSRYFIR